MGAPFVSDQTQAERDRAEGIVTASHQSVVKQLAFFGSPRRQQLAHAVGELRCDVGCRLVSVSRGGGRMAGEAHEEEGVQRPGQDERPGRPGRDTLANSYTMS